MSDAEYENWVTMKEAQAHLAVRRETISKWIANHNLPAYKVGRMWKFKLSEIDDWVRSGGASEEPQQQAEQSPQQVKEERQCLN